MNILDDFKSLIFYFHTFSVRRTIDVLDSENQPGSGKIWTGSGSGSEVLRLTGSSKYDNKKEEFKNDLKYLFKELLKTSFRLWYRAQDPVFCQNRILIPDNLVRH